jgi:hypothetical protein
VVRRRPIKSNLDTMTVRGVWSHCSTIRGLGSGKEGEEEDCISGLRLSLAGRGAEGAVYRNPKANEQASKEQGAFLVSDFAPSNG